MELLWLKYLSSMEKVFLEIKRLVRKYINIILSSYNIFMMDLCALKSIWIKLHVLLYVYKSVYPEEEILIM